MAQAAINKIAIVDMQKVVNKSTQVKNLQNEQNAKQKEIAAFVKKASDEISNQKNEATKKALAEKYQKELKAKQTNNANAYKIKLEAIDKNIKDTIAKEARLMGYDAVFNKGAVLYGGTDITEAILKVVK